MADQPSILTCARWAYSSLIWSLCDWNHVFSNFDLFGHWSYSKSFWTCSGWCPGSFSLIWVGWRLALIDFQTAWCSNTLDLFWFCWYWWTLGFSSNHHLHSFVSCQLCCRVQRYCSQIYTLALSYSCGWAASSSSILIVDQQLLDWKSSTCLQIAFWS